MDNENDTVTAHVITDAPARQRQAACASRHPVSQERDRSVGPRARRQRVALVDLLDRVLGTGVVIIGDVTLSLADVDMVTISVRALISTASSGLAPRGAAQFLREIDS
jgi:Gas vesicle protein